MAIHVIGLDYGTTYSFPMALDDATNELASLLYEHVQYGIPSVACCDDFASGHMIYGQAAASYARSHPAHAIHSAKQKLDMDRITLESGGANGGSLAMTPVDVVRAEIAEVIGVAQKRIEEYLRQDEPVRYIALTYPATFPETLRYRLQGCASDIHVGGQAYTLIGCLTEPAAAALSYLHGQNSREETVIVYDLGGGTFDCVVERIQRGAGGAINYAVLLPPSGARVGGDDWDEALVQYVLGECRKHGYVPPARRMSELRRDMRGVKIDLSSVEFVSFGVRRGIDDDDIEIGITRRLFEEITRSLLEQTLVCMRGLVAEAERRNLGVHKIIIVGGASNMPQVREALEREFGGRYQIIAHRPSMAIAEGAAIYGEAEYRNMLVPGGEQRSGGTTVVTSTTFNYGVDFTPRSPMMVCGALRSTDTFLLKTLIKPNTVLPAESEPSIFVTKYPGQEYVGFAVHEYVDGAYTDGDYALLKAGPKVMEATFSFGRAVPKGTQMWTKLKLNKNNIIELFIREDERQPWTRFEGRIERS